MLHTFNTLYWMATNDSERRLVMKKEEERNYSVQFRI